MVLPFFVFLLVAGGIVGGYMAMTQLPGTLAARRMDQRLRELSEGPVSDETKPDDDSIVKRVTQGPLPIVDRAIAQSGAGSWIAGLIAQSGVKVTPSAIVLFSLFAAAAAAW